MFTILALANTSIISHNYHFLFVVRTFKIYSLSNLQVYNTVLLTIITILDIRSPVFIHLIPVSVDQLTSVYSFPAPPAPGNHHSTVCFCDFSVFRFHVWIMQNLSFSVRLVSPNPCCRKWRDSLSAVPLCIHVPHHLQSSAGTEVASRPCCCEQRCCERGSADVSLRPCFHLLWRST